MRFGSVGGGGRYDGLVSRFRGEPVPATGFSIGVSRLQAALTALGKLGEQARARPGGGHRVRPRPRRRLPEAWSPPCARPTSAPSFISAIRRTISAPQLKYADKRGSPCAVIQGGDEKAQGRSADQGPDPRRGARAASKDRDEYLKKQAEAQFAVKEERTGRGSAQAARAPQTGCRARTGAPLCICHGGMTNR